MPERSSLLKRPRPIVLLTSLVILAGGVLLARAGVAEHRTLAWFWLATCALAEAGWIRLPDGRTTLSMGSIANFAAVLALPIAQAVLCASLASLVVEWAIMRKPLYRALYNCASTALTMTATGLVLHALSRTAEPFPEAVWTIVPLAAAAVSYYACNRALVIAAISVQLQTPPATVWRCNFGVRRDLLPSGAAFSLGVLLAHEYLGHGPVTLVLLMLPALFVLQAHRQRAAADTPGAGDRSVPTSGSERAA